MKYLKTTAAAALIVVSLAANAVPATATTLTSPAGTTYTSTLSLVSEGPFILHAFETFRCESSTFEGKVEGHGEWTTATAKVSSMAWLGCNHAFSVLNRGSLEVHTDSASADGNGTLTWTGAELGIKWVTIFGSFDCLYTLSNVNLGTVTGSKSTGGTATAGGGATKISVDGGIFCQVSEPEIKNEWTSPSYKIRTPDYLDVD
jgi:hypothetical protein